MRILVISDLHANLDALTAIQEPHDQVWVLGDLVNYGPQPREVIEWVRQHAAKVVRGNHDHAIGFDADPRCSPRFCDMAAATSQFTSRTLREEDKEFLRSLPITLDARIGMTRFHLLHALPSSPLFGYCELEGPRWKDELETIPAELVLVGHTHVPGIRRLGETTVVNPGSVGQPKIGRPEACYAIWEDGRTQLKSCPYPVERAIEKVQAMPVPESVREDLVEVLRTGSIREPRLARRAPDASGGCRRWRARR